MTSQNKILRDKMTADARTLIADAQEMIALISEQSSEKLSEINGKLQESAVKARENLTHLRDETRIRVKEASEATDAYVHEKPWKAVGIAAGVGLVVGVLFGRR